MTEYVVHTFLVRYRRLRETGAAVREAEVRATSAAEARAKWRRDGRARGNTLVSVVLKP